MIQLALPEAEATRMTMDEWWAMADGRCMVDDGQTMRFYTVPLRACNSNSPNSERLEEAVRPSTHDAFSPH